MNEQETSSEPIQQSPKKRDFKLLIILGIIFLVVVVVVARSFVIRAFNSRFGHSCAQDSDCHFICGVGSVNDNYVYVPIPYVDLSCVSAIPICEKNKCTLFDTTSAKTVDDCTRVPAEYRFYCYGDLAVKLNDSTVCDKNIDSYSKDQCVRFFIRLNSSKY